MPSVVFFCEYYAGAIPFFIFLKLWKKMHQIISHCVFHYRICCVFLEVPGLYTFCTMPVTSFLEKKIYRQKGI